MSDKIDPGALVATSERRRIYERGKRHADAHVAALRNEVRRWRIEAEFWKAECERLLKEFCDFTLECEEIVKQVSLPSGTAPTASAGGSAEAAPKEKQT